MKTINRAIWALALLAVFALLLPVAVADTGAADSSAPFLSSEPEELTGENSSSHMTLTYVTADSGEHYIKVDLKDVDLGSTLSYKFFDSNLTELERADGVLLSSLGGTSFLIPAENLTAGVYVVSITVGSVTDACSIELQSNTTYTITAEVSGSGGKVSATTSSGTQSSSSISIDVKKGSSQIIKFIPDSNYAVSKVTVNGNDVTSSVSNNCYTFTNVTSDQNLTVTFKSTGGPDNPPGPGPGPGPSAKTHTITASAGTGGKISPSGEVKVNDGASQIFTVTPDKNCEVDQVLVNGKAVSLTDGKYTFTNVTSDQKISVTFKSSETPGKAYTINASAGTGGSISPSGRVNVTEGTGVTFTVTVNKGYEIDKVLIDDKEASLTDGKYTFKDVSADHTISVTFKEVSVEPAPSGDDGNNNWIWYIIALIILILLIAALYYLMKNR